MKICNDLSVLISIYDGIKINLLKKSFESIYKQTILPKEIILVLDGVKRNEITKYVKNLKKKKIKIKVIKNKKNIGITGSYNKAIKYCKTELIVIQDSDDFSRKDRFQMQLDHFKKNKHLSLVGSSVKEKYKKKNYIKNAFKNGLDVNKIILFRNPINHPTVMYKRKAIIESGMYKNCYRMEDYHLWIRFLHKKLIFFSIQKPLVSSEVNDDFFKRRSDLKIILSELKIQLLLSRLKFNNIFFCIAIFAIKSFYHALPIILKRNFRLIFFKK
jgi:glycosyltransferase involved in cell wall biosynthesis